MFKNKTQNRPTGTTSVASSSTTGGKAPGSSNGAAAAKTASGVPSIISADLRIEGNLFSEGDVQVDGEVIGDIDSRTLTLGENSVVRGSISAETVRLCGQVEGEVRASTVVMTKTARITGDILHDSLAIEAGAFIDGHCKRLEAKPGEAAGQGAKAAPAQTSANGGSQPAAPADSSAAAAAK